MADDDLSEIPSAIRSTLRELVEEKLNTNEYKIDVKSASQAGATNFMGTLHRVSFSTDEENGNEENRIHKIIVKVAPQHLTRREQFFSRPSFLREIYMYEEVSNNKT